MNNYKEHPLASIFPMMAENELKELAEDIKQNGLRAKICLYEDKILDGRNRFKACRIAGVEPKFFDFNGNGDPVAYVVSANLHRRHLNESQRGLVAAKLAEMEKGRPKGASQKEFKGPLPKLSERISQAKAAEQLNVSERTVRTAKQVLKEAPKEEIEKVERGEKTVNAVAKELKQKAEQPKEQKPALDKTGYPIPSEILEDWQRAESFNETLKQLHRIKLAVEKAVNEGDLAFREVTNSTTADLKNILTSLNCVLPYAVCPTCNGRNRKKCTVCKQRGYVSKFAYGHWFPKETITIREASIKK